MRYFFRVPYLFFALDAATATPSPDEEVYLGLLKVYLQGQNKPGGHHPAQRKAGSPSSLKASDDGVAAVGEEVGGLDEAVSLLERHFSRVDPVKVMALLPPSVPVSKLVPFLSSAVRHAEARRRSNQVRVSLVSVGRADQWECVSVQQLWERAP